MKQTITNAAEITILRTIDRTLKTGGGPISIGATAVMASKGKPFSVVRTLASSREKLFGKPLPKKAFGAEGLRHLDDALKELLYCNVVRVVASDYRFPSLTAVLNGGQTCATAVTSTQVATATIGGTAETGDVVAVWLDDVPHSFTVTATENTIAKIATALAAVIDAAAEYTATAVGAVITITKVTAGRFTIVSAATNVAAGNDDQACTIAITSTQVATATLAGILGAGGTVSVVLGGVNYSYVIKLNDTVDLAATALAAIIDATAGYAATAVGPVITITKASPGSFTISGQVTQGSTVSANAHSAETTLSLGTGAFLQVWPIDGDPSVNRSMEITNVVTDMGTYDTATVYAVNDVVTVAGGRLICIAPHIATDPDPTLAATTSRWKVYKGQYDKRFTITLYDKDKDGTEFVLESYLVGVDPFDKDDMGQPAYIETVLEQQSTRFRANFNEESTWADVLTGLKGIGKVAFTGGTNGGEPEAEDWKKGWDLFRNETFAAYHMFAAGNYDADVISNMLDIADKRRVAAYFDVSPSLTFEQAIAWLKGTGLASRNARVTYSPFAATDATYGGPMVWGASGEKVAAKCRGEAIFSGATPGVHFAAAGPNRGMLTRTGVVSLHPEDALDRDALYDARICPIVAGDSGGAVIDDDLSLHFKEDYSRFAWIVDTDNYIAHRFLQGAAALKFEPDGLTFSGLNKMMKSILDEMVTSGALVPPRDPAADGTKPYSFTVEQVEIDLWLVTWDICPTGSARRIAGQPRYIK